MENNSGKKLEFKKDLRRFARIFIFVFLVVFLVVNGGKVRGMFDYGAVYGKLFKDFLSTKIKENEINNSYPFAALPATNSSLISTPAVSSQPQNTGAVSSPVSSSPVISKKPAASVSFVTGTIEIPKIGIKVPIIFQKSTNKRDLEKALKSGVVHYPTSAMPGENGAVMIAGHSAPAGWKRNYDWAFSKINELSAGSEIFIYYNNKKYQYLVTKQFFLTPGAAIPLNTSFANSLYLSTCWPPGQSKAKRLIIEARGNW